MMSPKEMNPKNQGFLISIVAPVWNESELLPEFYQRVYKALKDYRFELILVDDGSSDSSWGLIESYASKDPRVKAVSFSRNFGHQAALTAGLEHAQGDAVIFIDSDLQDPPEFIPEMIHKWQEGFDVVYCIRSRRPGESLFKLATAALFYRLLKKISRVDVPVDTGDFRLISRKVGDALMKLPERIRYLRGLTSWAGYRQTGIQYQRSERTRGETKFSLFRMIKLALDGITSLSSVPLQMVSYLGLIVTLVAFVMILYSLYVYFFTDTTVKGWTSLMIVFVFLGGIQLLVTGIIGEYIGRIYDEVKNRPVYLVQKTIGFDSKP